MAVKKLNPNTGKKEWVQTKGAILRAGGNVADQFNGSYSLGTGKKPVAPTPSSEPKLSSFGYVDTSGKMQSVNALDANSAMSTAKDIAKTSGVIQQTTSSQRAETMRRQNDMDSMQKRKQEDEAMMSEAESTKKTKEETTTSTTTAEKDPLTSKIKEIETKAQTEIDSLTGRLDKMTAGFDASSKSLISSIKSTYSARVEQMRQANTRLLATKKQIGMRSTGLARYAPTLQAGILADEEIAGHERIAELEGEMLQAVAKAQIAREEGKRKDFNDTYDKVDSIMKNMKTEIQNLHKAAVEQEKMVRDQEKAEREAEKASFDLAVKKSEAVASSVSKQLESYATEAEKNAFLETYAERIGVDLDVLLGEVEIANTKTKKDNLDIRSKQASIANTYDSINKRNEKKFGNADDQKKVAQYLSQYGTDNDIKKAKEDEVFFYDLLRMAEGE